MSNNLDRNTVLSFLKEEFIMTVATVSDQKPHSSVLLYTIDDDFTFYFVTHKDTWKAKNLLNNPYISLSVWSHGNMLVQSDGQTSVVEDESEKLAIIDRLAESASRDDHFWPPILRSGGHDYVIFKVTPYWMRALNLRDDSISAKESPYTEITFDAV